MQNTNQNQSDLKIFLKTKNKEILSQTASFRQVK